MYSEIIAAIQSLKTVTDIVKAASSMANYGEMLAAVNTVQEKLSQALVANCEASEKQSALRERVRELEEEIMKLKDWEAQSKDYTLQAVGIERRHFAQIYKPAVQSSKERHWVCAKCFQDRKLYILNAHGRHSYKCPSCGNEIEPILSGGALSPAGNKGTGRKRR